MKCCCHIHKEMYNAASAIWASAIAAFIYLFFIYGLELTLNHIIYWWVSVVTLRLIAVETVRFVMILRKGRV